MAEKSGLKVVEEMPPAEEAAPKAVEAAAPIAKPSAFNLDKFKAKRTSAASVETLQTGLPHHKFAAAQDFVRLHPDEDNCWSDELCLVSVPVKGQKDAALHLISEDLALQYLRREKSRISDWHLRPSPMTSSSCATSPVGIWTTSTMPPPWKLAR